MSDKQSFKEIDIHKRFCYNGLYYLKISEDKSISLSFGNVIGFGQDENVRVIEDTLEIKRGN